ncbi:multicopper oxidase domain-containing protein [Nitrolancea hollandica]|uniref:Putative Multicopper oxidase n=1 Tax=Nitrolancea hollandica Lb TaxID=1129897 RepID=I4EHU7_9BACT|nr:multicopper oxidase domain-containing protein [Nitrolancea hollandica]CCF84259.1 putative Multicopper oxidase [Nitrolancea hollandica Lb]
MVRVLGISRSLPRRSIPWLIIGLLAAMPLLVIGCSQQSDSATEHSMTPGASMATPASGTGQTRTYYIAADEVDWNYAPSDRNQITGQPFDDEANVFVENGPDRIGKVYHKSLYREYTDQTFTTLKETDPKWQHLGTLGPVIHAEVGDSIQVVFKNNTQFPASMHPHGVFYQKNAEGAPYNDGTSGGDQADDAVPPGGTYTYHWEVPERAGPGPHDPSSVIWMYHSHTDEIADGYAGLVGPMIITRQGSAKPDGSPNDVDREFVTMFSVIDENASPYLEQNIKTFAQQPDSVKPDDEEFQESNLMHSINGYVYGNLPGLAMKQGERVRWYVLGMGNEVDLHTPHWHGQTLLMGGMRMDMVELLPMSMKVLDMIPDNPGTWLYHCHVNDHIQAGMQALFTVTP